MVSSYSTSFEKKAMCTICHHFAIDFRTFLCSTRARVKCTSLHLSLGSFIKDQRLANHLIMALSYKFCKFSRTSIKFNVTMHRVLAKLKIMLELKH